MFPLLSNHNTLIGPVSGAAAEQTLRSLQKMATVSVEVHMTADLVRTYRIHVGLPARPRRG